MTTPIFSPEEWEAIAKYAPPSEKMNEKGPYGGCWLHGEFVGYARCMVKQVIPLLKEIEELKKLTAPGR